MTQEKRIRYLKYEIASVKESIESLSEYIEAATKSQPTEVPIYGELIRLINQDVLLGFRRILEKPETKDLHLSGTLESLIVVSNFTCKKESSHLAKLKDIRSNSIFRNINDVVRRGRVAHTDSRKFQDTNVVHLAISNSQAHMLIDEITSLFREVLNVDWKPEKRFHLRRLLTIIHENHEF